MRAVPLAVVLLLCGYLGAGIAEAASDTRSPAEGLHQDKGPKVYRLQKMYQGNSDPQIENALPALKDALQRCGLHEMTDSGTATDLNLILELPDKKLNKAGSFHYRVTPEKREIRISAIDGEGLRCGILRLLEEMGERHFRPDAPAIRKLRSPLTLAGADRIIEPSFSYRGLHICGGTNHYDESVAAWMSHIGMNRKLTHHNEVDIVGEKLARQGLKPDTTAHSYSFWIPDKKYFDSNPEYFALVGGKRIRQKEGGQLCLSNREMRAEFLRNIYSYIEKHPDVKVVGIPPNDGYGWCECAECRKLDTAQDKDKGRVNGRVADFVSYISGQIEKRYPQILVGHYSYSNFADFLFACKSIPDNLMISVTVNRCYKHAIGDPACPINRPVYERLKRYREKVKHIYIYDYYTQGWDALPAPIWRVTAEDMKDYKALDLEGFMSEVGGADSQSWKSFHLPIYVAGRFLLDVNSDLDALLNDYCRFNYGPAAGSMRSYLNLLEKSLQRIKGCFTKDPGNFEAMFTKQVQRESLRLLNKALAESRKAPEYYGRVKQEKELYDSWVHIYKERARYGRATSVESRPLKEMDAGIQMQESGNTLKMVDVTTQVPPSNNQTLVRAYAGEEEIGLLIESRESRMNDLKIIPGSGVNAVWGSDSIEIFIASSRDAAVCYQFIVNPEARSCVCECDLVNKTRWNWAWPGEYEAVVNKQKDRWTVDFRAGKKSLGIEGDTFYFMVVRNRRVEGWETSAVPGNRSYRDPQVYIESRPKPE